MYINAPSTQFDMKAILPLLALLIWSFSSQAQKLERPAPIGEGVIDTYVDNSFDVYEEIQAQKNLYAEVEQLLNTARSAGSLDEASATAILDKLEQITLNLTRLDERVKALAADLPNVQAASKQVPKLKVAKAVKAVDAANQANKTSAADIVELSRKVKEAGEAVASLRK